MYEGRVRQFCKYFDIDADKLIELWKQVKYDIVTREKFVDEWSEKLEDYYNSLKDYAPMSKQSMIAVMLSYFKFYGINLRVHKDKYPYVKYHNRALTKEEIKRILEHSNIRDRAFFLIALESGLRPKTIVNLQYKHIKIDFEKETIPMSIEVPAEIVKERARAFPLLEFLISYFSFNLGLLLKSFSKLSRYCLCQSPNKNTIS